MAGTFRIAVTLAGLVLFLDPMYPQDRVAEFRSRFDREQDPVHRAKLMPYLGDVEFQEIKREVAEGKLSDALVILEKYRDETQSCEKDLDSRGIDAEKHPAGFKQLEISLRQSLRRLDDLLVGLPADDQKPFLAVRKELEQLNRHLVRELFPRQPEGEQGKPKS